jgi:hypothetical protein
MERDSNRHNPRVDDVMAKEASSVTHGAPVEARTDEGRLVEDGAEWEPVAQSFVASGATDDEAEFPYQAVRDRSELARHLRPSIFPATRAELVACAVEEHADPELVEQLGALPERVYRTTNEV